MSTDAAPDHRLIRRMALDEGDHPRAHPFDVPAVLALRDAVEFHPQVTFLVGENGSGKSTIVEALGEKLELDAEGGDDRFTLVREGPPNAVAAALTLTRGARRPSMRYFLRAESFFNVAATVDENPGALEAHGGRALHEMSHGESFLALALERWVPDGLFVLDEPEAALSPQGCLSLLRRIRELAIDGAQFVIATHSPLLLAYPDAWIYELSAAGIARCDYDDTDLVRLTRSFLDDPPRFLHHLFG